MTTVTRRFDRPIDTVFGVLADPRSYPAWLVGARCKVPGPVAVLTLMQTVEAGSITDAGISMDDARAVVTWSENGVGRGLTIDRVMSGAIVRGPFSRPETVVSSS